MIQRLQYWACIGAPDEESFEVSTVGRRGSFRVMENRCTDGFVPHGCAWHRLRSPGAIRKAVMSGTSQTNYFRRGVALLIAAAPLVLIATSILRALSEHQLRSVVGVVVELLALLIGGLNLYLSFRPALHERRTGSRDGYRHVSGVPMVGTLLTAAGVTLGFGALAPAVMGLVAVVIDTGGFPWFLIGTWSDSSLWDTTRR
jgi:hypothetical protein